MSSQAAEVSGVPQSGAPNQQPGEETAEKASLNKRNDRNMRIAGIVAVTHNL